MSDAKDTNSAANSGFTSMQEIEWHCLFKHIAPFFAMDVLRRTRTAVKPLIRLWKSNQVSHLGRYSLERTLSLDEYVQSTSTTHAMLVMLCTPIPVLVVSISTDVLPLYDPMEGWRASYSVWVRTLFLTVALAALIGIDVRDMVPGRPISNRQIVLLVIGVAVLYMPMAIAVAALWTFPIPFMICTMSVPYTTTYSLMLRWIVGATKLRKLQTESPGAILRHAQFIQAGSTLIIVYPAFQALFITVNDTSSAIPLLVIGLPSIKLLLKQLVARRAAHVEDLIPEIVVVTVELFNAFYLATNSTLLLDSQRVLFTIEYIVLAEYYELISPFFYAAYITFVSGMPSAKYHAELDGLAGSALGAMLTNNVLFATLKLASFVLLVATLRRISGHDALRHVAFVLETRVVPVQVKMLVWILMVVGFRIVHFGVDFTFQFEWMHAKQRT